MWLARVSAFAANSIVLVSYVSFFVPQTAAGIGRGMVIVATAAVITFINVRGVADGAHFGGIFAAVKVAALLSFVIIGVGFVDWQRVLPSSSPLAANVKWGEGLLLLLYAYMGFESLGNPAAEAKNPRKDLPSAWLTALAIYASIYVTVQIVASGTVSDLASSQRPLADSAQTFLGPIGGSLMSLLVCISVLGNLSAIALLTPRVTFALAEHGQFPAVLGKLHPVYRTPAVSIVLFGAVATLLALSGTFVWLATVSVIARLASFITTCLALPVLRQRFTEPPRFKVRGGTVVAAAGILLCAWLISRAQFSDLWAFGLAAAAGALLYVATRTRRPGTTL